MDNETTLEEVVTGQVMDPVPVITPSTGSGSGTGDGKEPPGGKNDEKKDGKPEEAQTDGNGNKPLPPRSKIPTHRHSYLIYLLMLFGSLSVGLWYYTRRYLCWRDSFYQSTGGGVVCNAHRGTYVMLLLALIVFGFLAVELSELGFEAEGGKKPRGVRSAFRGYRSLERKDFVHVSIATAWLVLVLGIMVWFRVLSDWWIK